MDNTQGRLFVICFTHRTPKSPRSLFKGVREFQVELEFRSDGFVEGRKLENLERNCCSRDEKNV